MPYLLKDINYPVGGATVEWNAWIKGFIANNQRVGVLTFKGAGEYTEKTTGFDIVETYDQKEGVRILRWLYKRYPSIIRAVREYAPDYIIQECAGFETGLMAHIGKRTKTPFIYRVANDMDTDERYEMRLNKYQQIVYKYGLNNADAIICQNNYQYHNIKRNYPLKKVTVLHNPYFYEGELCEIKKRSDRKYIAWLGVFQQQKNLPALVEIVKSLKTIEFRVGGKAGNRLDDTTRKALNELEHCTNVTFTGYLKRSEIMDFMSNAHALLNTSHYEGFSNTFLEAFLAGTPIVTTGMVDPDDIIGSNRLGMISSDYKDLPGAITALLASNDYDAVAERCRQYVLKKHDPRVLSHKFAEFLQSITS